jgi:hypothetical protein
MMAVRVEKMAIGEDKRSWLRRLLEHLFDW